MRKGFTIVELLGIIIILGVMGVLVFPNVLNSIEKSKKDQRQQIIDNGIKAAENYVTLNEDFTGDISFEQLKEEGFIKNIKDPITNSAILGCINVKIENDVLKYTYNNNVEECDIGQSKVYGLRWDGNNTYTRLEDAVGMQANAGVGTTEVTNDFDNAEIYKDIEDVTVDGNVFMKIPKFYIKKVVSGNTWEWYVSKDKKDDNYYLPACFYDFENNIELDYVLIGKYEGGLNGTKLTSIKDSIVAVDNNGLNSFRTYAINNNVGGKSGYQLFDIHALDMIQVLFYVEFGTLNSQDIMMGFTYGKGFGDTKIISTSGNTITLASGKGQAYRVGQLINVYKTSNGTNLTNGVVDCKSNLRITAINGDVLTFETTIGTVSNANIATNYYVGTASYLTGTTDSVVATSGSPVDNSNGYYSMKYRGIENLYGNKYHLIDGIYKKEANIYVSKKVSTYSNYDGANTDYYAINYSPIISNAQFTSKMGYDSNNPFIQIPIEVGGSSSTYYGDWFLNFSDTSTISFPLMGGSWNSNYRGGLTYYELGVDTGGIHVGARLMKRPL